jgi:hypothetical protein
MTLEQTTWRVIAAAEALDPAALETAAKERATAIAALSSVPPTPALLDQVAASIAAGEEAKRALRAIKQRIRKDSRRLAHIQTGFLRALTPVASHQVDCEG